MNNKISIKEIAILLAVSTNSVNRMRKMGRVPVVGKRLRDENSGHIAFMFDREKILAWIATNPVKHPGYRDEDKRHEERIRNDNTLKDDVYNIRKPNAKPFVYSGSLLMYILFCCPALRNGRHSYDDCNLNHKI